MFFIRTGGNLGGLGSSDYPFTPRFSIERYLDAVPTLNKLRFRQIHCLALGIQTRQSGSQSLNNFHVIERFYDGFISALGFSRKSIFHTQSVIQHPRGIHFNAVIIDGHLNGRRIQITTMQHSVRNHLANGLNRQFIIISAVKSVNYRASIDMLQYKLIGILNLILYGAVKFFPVDKFISV